MKIATLSTTAKSMSDISLKIEICIGFKVSHSPIIGAYSYIEEATKWPLKQKALKSTLIEVIILEHELQEEENI